MSVEKKTLANKKRVSWGYEFAVGSRGEKTVYKQAGFATRDEAIQAESAKRLELKRAIAIKSTGTLAGAISRFFDDRADDLSPKTMARYRELATYLHPDLMALPITEVRALNLHDEWTRLLREGGHKRGTKEARPLSKKTVRNIASVVSSACAWAVLYDLIQTNPATASKPPSGKGKAGLALAPSQVQLMTGAAVGWLAEFLEVEAGLGIRRGEALALRWSDIRDGVAYVTRSLGQVGAELYFKSTKTGKDRRVDIPASTMAALECHRAEQAKARAAFPDYDTTGDLVFANPDGSPLKPDSVSAKVSLLCRTLKLPKGASLHTLRHSHFSQLIADGADPAAVAARAGHENAATTLGVYTHAVPGRGNLADAWEKLQGKGKAN